MARRILLIPTNHQADLTSTSLGLVHALDEIGSKVGYLKPLAQIQHGRIGQAADLMEQVLTNIDVPDPISVQEVERDLARGEDDDLMEKVLAVSEEVLANHDVVVIEGVLPTAEQTYSGRVNHDLAQALDAEVLLVAGVNSTTLPTLISKVAGAAAFYQVGEQSRVMGVLLTGHDPSRTTSTPEDFAEALNTEGLRLVGLVEDEPATLWPRVRDVARELGATIIHAGDQDRRMRSTQILAQGVPGCIAGIDDGVLAVVPGDRHDAIMAVCLAEMTGTKPAALLMTAGVRPDIQVRQLCQPALDAGLPVLLTGESTFTAVNRVINRDKGIPVDDVDRTRHVTEAFAKAFDDEWVRSLPSKDVRPRLSPAAFRRQLTTQAQRARKRIVLPEGAEPRTVEAAFACQTKGVADCVLLAKPEDVMAAAVSRGLTVPEDITIIDPSHIDQRYVDALVERRKHKGMTDLKAYDQLTDPTMLGTMMVHLGEVDGLVSGAVNTTANTVRPALQVLGTKPGAKLVSSVFFMCLPDDVVVYGDCAINPDPNAEELADIAIQSADSAAAFGIEPRVAMISFSTGTSGAGADVIKVAEATEIVRQKRPEILIDGPLQYDAATTASVAKSKAPESNVAGRATVFVFPDLNTGNTTYKAVQRSASVISIGPMLQGLSAPVNDLSRGALVEDIEYTIALTAIQAAAKDNEAKEPSGGDDDSEKEEALSA
ncbi:MAG TPA: phosphate acetyltransferase [Propionibacterium sp.]|jgi:phosphate acetyltransferase|nr:phosphate acetyltransferase [Propionibacterium sp.]